MVQTIKIRSPSLVRDASSIRLYKDSNVVYSSRKNYDLACGMVSVFLLCQPRSLQPFLYIILSMTFSPPPHSVGLPQVPI